MKVVILAGGYGTRLGSVGESLPKPLLKIGGKPILWHIMKIYSSYGFNEFIICLGYKGEMIKDFFYNHKNKNSDMSIDLSSGEIEYHEEFDENWKITLIDTGLDTLKGGRIKRIEKYLESDVNMFTYGDGIANIDISKLVAFHSNHGKTMTITGVRPPSMFGEVLEEDGRVISFEEKPQTSKGLINGGFAVFNKSLLSHLSEDEGCDLEFGAMEKLALDGEVMTYKHKGFWECADTVRDIDNLNRLWKTGNPLWKVW